LIREITTLGKLLNAVKITLKERNFMQIVEDIEHQFQKCYNKWNILFECDDTVDHNAAYLKTILNVSGPKNSIFYIDETWVHTFYNVKDAGI
jgi:hypothetical protein